MAHRLLLLALICYACTLDAQTADQADSSMLAIRALYDKGSYIDAEVEARRLLEQPGLSDSLRITAEQYIAFALVAQGKPRAAAAHFSAILDADSTFDLDPLYISPKIIAALNEAKQIRRLQAQRAPAEPAPQQPVRSLAAASAVSWRTLVFPGWEQLHQGRATAGYGLLGAGTIAAALSIGFELERASARRAYLDAVTMEQASARYDRYNRAHKAGRYALFSFVAIYLYSELDAFLNLPHADRLSLESGTDGSVRLSIRW